MLRCNHKPLKARRGSYDKSQCRLCWLFINDRSYRKHWGGLAKTEAKHLPPCQFEGPIVQWCPRDLETKHIRHCLYDGHDFDRCMREAETTDVRACNRCPHYAAQPVVEEPPEPRLSLLRKFDQTTLWPLLPGMRFNPSIIADPAGGYILVARNGWRGSELLIGRLDAEFNPRGEPTILPLWHREANYGREDPRLFWFRGQLHVSFIGVVGGRRIRHTNVLYARLGPEFQIEETFAPRLAGRNLWEKNWAFFEAGGELLAVYSIAPHKIIRIQGEHAEFAYESLNPASWESGAEMRGGASPVLVGDEWYHFFHSKRVVNGRLRYEMGCYTFENAPPFRVRRFTPTRIIDSDPTTRPHEQYCDCFFPCGAIAEADRWVIAAGIHDRWSEIHTFGREDIERQLRPVTHEERANAAENVRSDVFANAVANDGGSEAIR